MIIRLSSRVNVLVVWEAEISALPGVPGFA